MSTAAASAFATEPLQPLPPWRRVLQVRRRRAAALAAATVAVNVFACEANLVGEQWWSCAKVVFSESRRVHCDGHGQARGKVRRMRFFIADGQRLSGELGPNTVSSVAGCDQPVCESGGRHRNPSVMLPCSAKSSQNPRIRENLETNIAVGIQEFVMSPDFTWRSAGFACCRASWLKSQG